MAVMVHKAKFDPEAHLHKQGWKGKGTALKAGHATRPLAVVRKKNLGGIGKDRDEAVPFWDNIFATTAASILSSTTPSAQASPSGTPGPSSPAATPSWQSSGSKAGISTATRVSREIARRGLYSRFFRGKVTTPLPDEDETLNVDVPPQVEVPGTDSVNIASSSSSGESQTEDVVAARAKTASKGKAREGKGEETKEERRARRAEKAARKAEKAEKKRLKEEKRAKRAAEKETLEPEGSAGRKRKAGEADAVAEATVTDAQSEENKKKKKKRKTKSDD